MNKMRRTGVGGKLKTAELNGTEVWRGRIL